MKITAISTNDKQLFEIARILRERSQTDQVEVLPGMLEKLPRFEGGAPDLLLVAQPLLNGADLDRLETLGAQNPDMAMIVACGQQTPDFLLQAMRAGVREVMPMPIDSAALQSAVRRIEEKRNFNNRALGKVLAFISCKGGSGATFLAANLGYALAAEIGRASCRERV